MEAHGHKSMGLSMQWDAATSLIAEREIANDRFLVRIELKFP